MKDLPAYIHVTFLFATALTLIILYLTGRLYWITLSFILVWLLIQAIVSINGFYTITDTTPPRFMIAVLPPLFLIIILFTNKKGLEFIGRLDIGMLTLLHMVRIPVELVLYWLFIHKLVPEVMSFEGRNFDILAGISAPLVYYGIKRKKVSNLILLIWNFICVLLLLNIVVHAVLSAPFPFQKFGFDQPNIAVFYFPFIWLPSFIVPIVLFSHLAVIIKLLKQTKFSNTNELVVTD